MKSNSDTHAYTETYSDPRNPQGVLMFSSCIRQNYGHDKEKTPKTAIISKVKLMF